MKKIISTFAIACIAFTLTGCNNTIPSIDCLTTNMGTSEYNQIMKTENGYYYNSSMLGNMSLRYHDNTTDKDIYLCAKPECTHDGDKFCTATSEGFHVHYTGMYDNTIYITASEHDGKHIYLKLLKASLDGTELTELCTVVQSIGSDQGITLYFNNTNAMILHRGYAFIPYYLVSNSIKVGNTIKTSGRAGIAIVNLSDGSVQYMPEYEQSETDGYKNITPDEDYLYYTYTMNFKTEMHRYNFITGEDELLPLKANIKETYDINLELKELKSYTIIDGKIWYICGSESSMFIYDPNTNTTTLVEEFERKFLEEIKEYVDNGILVYTEYYSNPKLMYDGNYLYVKEYYDSGIKVHIFTLEGDELGEFFFELEEYASCQINILDETFYIQTKENTVCCPVSNVLSGNIQWNELYQFEKGEY